MTEIAMPLQRKLTLGASPPLGKRRSREKQHAASNHAHTNSTGSACNDDTSANLLNLPAELILLVCSNTSSASIQALRQTCRKLYHNLDAPDLEFFKIRATPEELAEYRNLRKRQRFFETCTAEEDKHRPNLHLPSQPLAKYLCSGCLTRHGKSAFTSDELSRVPSERRCKGTQGSLKVCEHVNFKFDELSSSHVQVHSSAMRYAAPTKPDVHGAAPDEGASGCPDTLYFYHGKPLFKEAPHYPEEEWRPSIWLFCTFPLLRDVRGPRMTTTTVSMVAHALSKNNTRICPHMRVNDASVLRCAHKTSRPRWHKKKPFEDNKPVTWLRTWTPLWLESPMVMCFSPGCMTVFHLRLEMKNVEEELYDVKLCVQRDVGLLHDACDHKWLSQISDEQH